MSCDIEAASPARPLHRVARRPDAWAWPDWAYAGPDGTFGSRYGDPRGEYRVLYASCDRLGAFVEVLARFRPEPAVLRGLDEIEVEPGARDDGPAPGRLPRSWLVGRVVGTALADGPFAALGAARSLAYLRDRLSSAGRARAVYKHTGAGAGLACSDLGIPGASHTLQLAGGSRVPLAWTAYGRCPR